MKLTYTIVLGLVLAATSSLAEKKVKLKDLPPAVKATVENETKNGKLVGLSQEQENGKTVYELETKVGARSRDLMIDSSGNVLSVEEESTLSAIPAPARAAIEKATAGGKISKVEIVTKGKTVTYEAAYSKNGKKAEIMVNADGSVSK